MYGDAAVEISDPNRIYGLEGECLAVVASFAYEFRIIL